jgi:hypothetical protein
MVANGVKPLVLAKLVDEPADVPVVTAPAKPKAKRYRNSKVSLTPTAGSSYPFYSVAGG